MAAVDHPTIVRVVNKATMAAFGQLSGGDVAITPGPGPDQVTVTMQADHVGPLLRRLTDDRAIAVTDHKRQVWLSTEIKTEGDKVTIIATKRKAG